MSNQNGRPRGQDFPCESLEDALVHLRRPPKPAAVRFKLQTAVEEAGQVAVYIDARLVYDRLDRVCGSRWFPVFEELPERLIPPPIDRNGERLRIPPLFVRCRLSCFGVVRQDVGEGDDPKAAFSDAIKRAAVQFGIGRALYATRTVWLREGDGDTELRRNSKGRLIIDRRTEDRCRSEYERWLENEGIRKFGEPLDHGDAVDVRRARAASRTHLRAA